MLEREMDNKRIGVIGLGLRVGTRKLRTFGGLEAHFACSDAHFLLARPPLNSPSPEIGKVWVVSRRRSP
jgi:hypothetical protein